ncbi:uncharacterized protein SOCE26_082640 [Sorangium cellulosum]|uniref:TIR domain-containing protein n=1 Tax=Sorangium cellulosum TaxID=56 RepID=A0A2L0F5A7_SORCE|nr:toll/interleukin-1 receptor domain-containing protein [Sorangium cellulosum]AUX46755.1 uncharacterized protein SOCE26_082640 [Sorangium cellulosum]
MAGQPTVIISYHHRDKEWKDRLVQHLRVIEKQGLLEVWDDERIDAGENWRHEIAREIERARVAVLLVSADFLASDFVLAEEVPRLLRGRQSFGLRVLPVLVSPCLWQAVPWLAEMKLLPYDGRPLSAGAGHSADANLAAISGEILRCVASVAPWVDARAHEPRFTAVEQRAPTLPRQSRGASSGPRKRGSQIVLILVAVLMYVGLATTCLSVLRSTGSQSKNDDDQDRKIKELLREAEADLLGAERKGPDASTAAPPVLLPDPSAADLRELPSEDDGLLPMMPSEPIGLDLEYDPALLGYRGIVQDAVTKALVRGVHVTLLGTPCDAWTDAAGMFDFVQCDPVSVSRLMEPRVLIELPNGVRCSDIYIQRPPAVTRIRVSEKSCAVASIGDAGL